MKRHKAVAWTLVGLVAAGVVVPPFVLYFVQPQSEEQVMIEINGTLPLDVFFLLDASRSVGEQSWNLAVDFATEMGLKLKEELPKVRAGMGQFADKYEVIHPLSENFSDWTVGSRVVRMQGHTDLATGLCGNDVEMPVESCKGGAYGELANAAKLPPSTDDVICGITEEALKRIILVTDGVPAKPELAVAAVNRIKATNASIMGILVQGADPDQQANLAELYALTSCCPSSDTKAIRGRWGQNRPTCTSGTAEGCPDLFERPDFHALVTSVHELVETLEIGMNCTGKSYTTRFHADFGVLWFLLLLAPAVVFLCWQNMLLCMSASQRFAAGFRDSLPFRRPEVEMSSTLSSTCEELDAASAAAVAVGLGEPTGGPDVTDVPAEPTDVAAGEGGGARGSAGGSGARGSAEGGGARGSAERGEGHRGSDMPGGGKKWAPVRMQYIVNGQRMVVDYGQSAPPPPSAQLGAHRGQDQWDEEQDSRYGQGQRPWQGPPITPRRRHSFRRQFARQFSSPFEEVPDEEVAPPLRKFNYTVLIPLVCTLVLLPIVVWKSGILRIMGVIH